MALRSPRQARGQSAGVSEIAYDNRPCLKEDVMAEEEEKAGKEIEVGCPARVLSPFDEMDRWFEQSFPRGWMRRFRRA